MSEHFNKPPLRIDGSFGEGGGQIIRTAVSLSAITGKPVEIFNVRARRTKPGLQPQHLTAVRAAATLCAAQLKGDEVGSTTFSFHPQAAVQAGDYKFSIGTAGAATLVAQTVLVPLATIGQPSTVRLTGGTHVPHSPPAEYLEAIYVPILREAKLNLSMNYLEAGFFPRGGGSITLGVEPAPPLRALNFSARGALQQLRAYIVTANLPPHVGERCAATVEAAMKAVGRKVQIEHRVLRSAGPGAAVVLVAECEAGRAAFSAIGELRKPMEKVAEAPCKEFMKWWKTGAACDEHLADQLVLPMALADGESRWTTPVVTDHLRTVLWVVQHFLAIDYNIEERNDGLSEVRLQGVPLEDH